MAILDVIEYFDPTGREMVHRVPEAGSGDFRIGSQLIVRESQAAVFFRDGKGLDTFGPGRHTLATANLPLLDNLISLPFGETPFKAEVYFVNMRQFLDQKWGTPEAITVRDSELGMVRLRAFGTYSMQISEPQLFVNAIVGTQNLYDTSDIEGFLRGIIVTRLTDLLGTMQKGKSILDLPQLFDEISAGTKAKVKDDFSAVGIDMRAMYINSISPTEETAKAIDERAAMGAIGNMQAYMQFKTARAIGDMAQAEGEPTGTAATGMGLGAGFGMGAMMAGMMSQAMQPGPGATGAPQPGGPAPGAPVAPAGAAVVCPNCSAQVPAGSRFCNVCGTEIPQGVQCASCEAILPFGSKFCTQCGAKIGTGMICANCKADLPEDAKFCHNCGTKVA
ncbi:MAG: SPFH domain-containing protein [Anaerolineae bacterium]